jgi:hypothetical protein
MEKPKLALAVKQTDVSSFKGLYVVEDPLVEHMKGGDTAVQKRSGPLAFEQDVDPLLRVAIYFKRPIDRDVIFFAAQRQKLTLSAFMAAAVRMALMHQLVLKEFGCSDPTRTNQ